MLTLKLPGVQRRRRGKLGSGTDVAIRIAVAPEIDAKRQPVFGYG
jgi:hypothetical protein